MKVVTISGSGLEIPVHFCTPLLMPHRGSLIAGGTVPDSVPGPALLRVGLPPPPAARDSIQVEKAKQKQALGLAFSTVDSLQTLLI